MWSLNISQRLYGVAILVSLGLVMLAALAFWQLNEVRETARRTEEIRVQQLAQAAATELNVTRVSLQLRHAILARNPAELEDSLADIAEKRRLIAETLKAYESTLFTEEGRSVYARLPVVLDEFWRMGTDNIRLIEAGLKADAFDFLVDETIPARNAVLAVLSEMVDYQRASLARDIDGISKSVDVTLNTILILLLGSSLLLFASSAYIRRMLRARVHFTRDVVERIRDGSLNQAIEDPCHDEFSSLITALAKMQDRLNDVVTRVRTGADFLDVANLAISKDNDDLSDRTRVQAASLHATTEAAKLLSGRIEHNFDNARLAVSMSNSAVEVAQRGGAVVSSVVSTMEEINVSSKRIEEIVGLIDGIAFQTSILALNAAVEAARAGEQGKGFAVVAAEVRSLAQDSSRAANEIRQLISTSVDRVAAGSLLVARAGAAMQEIVDSIVKVKNVVNNINAANEEQDRSLVEVNSTMADMETATGENAALVRKMNKATGELRKMSNELVSTVAYFQTRGTRCS